MSVTVDTNQYVFSQGRAPRGRGTWAFRVPGMVDYFWFTGSYADARRAAVAQARAVGAMSVQVQP